MNELPREQVLSLRKRIRPLMGLWYINVSKVDPVDTSYTFVFEPLMLSRRTRFLKKLQTIEGRFPVTGFYGMFKPSEEEVLAQIPKDILDEVNCYQITPTLEKDMIVDGGKTQVAMIDFYRDRGIFIPILDNGFWVRGLYRLALFAIACYEVGDGVLDNIADYRSKRRHARRMKRLKSLR